MTLEDVRRNGWIPFLPTIVVHWCGHGQEVLPILAKDGPVTVEALEAILSRSMVPILRQLEEKPPELVMALLPSLVRTMLAVFVELLAERSESLEIR